MGILHRYLDNDRYAIEIQNITKSTASPMVAAFSRSDLVSAWNQSMCIHPVVNIIWCIVKLTIATAVVVVAVATATTTTTAEQPMKREKKRTERRRKKYFVFAWCYCFSRCCCCRCWRLAPVLNFIWPSQFHTHICLLSRVHSMVYTATPWWGRQQYFCQKAIETQQQQTRI